MIARALLRSQPDHRLVELAAAGSDPAFAALVTRHRRLLDATARRALLPAPAAEDAVQSALLAAWEALQRGVEVREPVAWLAGITRNHALQARRSSSYGFAELHEALAGGELPEDELLRRTEIREALAGLAALPERQRDALLRTAVDGASHEEAARAMGTDPGAVRNLVFRARTTLRGSLGALVPGPALVWAARGSMGALGPAGDGVAAGAAAAGGTALGLKAATAVVAVGALGALGGTALVPRQDRDPAQAQAASRRPAAPSAAATPASRPVLARATPPAVAVSTHARAPAARAARHPARPAGAHPSAARTEDRERPEHAAAPERPVRQDQTEAPEVEGTSTPAEQSGEGASGTPVDGDAERGSSGSSSGSGSGSGSGADLGSGASSASGSGSDSGSVSASGSASGSGSSSGDGAARSASGDRGGDALDAGTGTDG